MNYRTTTWSRKLEVKSGAEIKLEAIRTSDSAHNGWKKSAVLEVTDELVDRNERWKETWRFELPSEQALKVAETINEVEDEVKKRSLGETERREHYLDATDNIRVGWVFENNSWYGYLRFLKERRSMTSHFQNSNDLVLVASLIERSVG